MDSKFKKALKEIKNLQIADEKYEKERKIDEWFDSLTISQRADVGYNFWDNASFEEKKREYELE